MNDGKKVPVMKFKYQIEEKAKRIWNSHQIVKNK
jgi:hypothetical protein